MQETMARGFLKMTAGQLADLNKAGSAETSVDDVEASVVAKSGEEYAMFALLSAQLAQTNEKLMKLCSSFGQACGVAAQLFSDTENQPTAIITPVHTVTARKWREWAMKPLHGVNDEAWLAHPKAITRIAVRNTPIVERIRSRLRSLK